MPTEDEEDWLDEDEEEDWLEYAREREEDRQLETLPFASEDFEELSPEEFEEIAPLFVDTDL